MARVCLVALLCLLLTPFMSAQSIERSRRAEIVGLLEQRLQARQELDVVADAIVLTGRVLRLKGHARIGGGANLFVVADEATIDSGQARVELKGHVLISRGSPARIERW